MKKHALLSCLACMCMVFASFAAAPAFAQVGGLTPAHPLKVDTKERSVSVLAQVNGKYLVQPTRHGLVFKEGKNGSKSVFTAFADPQAFYDGLLKIGAKAGNNLTMANKDKTLVQGDILDVSVTWKGAKRAYRLDEAIRDASGKPLQIRFGGNLAAAREMKTGCLMCLESCPVGITSNAAYTYGAIETRKEASLMGNRDVLPPDGTFVVVTFRAHR
jgi:hypothetical protein